MVFDRPRPSDLDAQGNPIPRNAQQRRTLNDEVAEYDRLDSIAFSDLIKACRQNVKVKNLSETGEFNTAFELLQRLRQRYYKVDDITKAKHMLNYHALTQGESKSGAEFVDRELREYLALRDMGVQIDDSIRLTKFIQQDTTNTKHKQWPKRSSRRQTGLLAVLLLFLRLIHRLDLLQLQQLQRSTQSLVVTTKEKTTNYQIVPRRSQFPITRGLKTPIRLLLHGPDQRNARGFHVPFAILWITCLICVLVVRKPEGVLLSPPAGRLHRLRARTEAHCRLGHSKARLGA